MIARRRHLVCLVMSAVVLSAGCPVQRIPGPTRIVETVVDDTAAFSIRDAARRSGTSRPAGLHQAAVAHLIAEPAGWPEGTAWRPRRHFGPFYRGSHLEHIEAKLSGNSASVYHNEFFDDHDDAPIFRKYYGSPLPTNATPDSEHVPGAPNTMAGRAGANDVTLPLQRIAYSSEYGGSIELLFENAEEFEYEFVSGDTLWDVPSVAMRAYVVPRAGYFNPDNPIGSAQPGEVELELAHGPARTYVDEGTGVRRLDIQDGVAGHLDRVLASIVETTEGAPATRFRRDVKRLAHGFVHAQFQNTIGPTDRVEMIEIADDFLDLHTRDAEGVFMFLLEVEEVRLDTEPGGEEIEVGLRAGHMFENGEDAGAPPTRWKTYDDLDDGDGTPLTTLGIFRVEEECSRLQSVIFGIDVAESDPLDDDQFDPIYDQAEFDCSVLEQRVDAGELGVAHRVTSQGEALVQDGDVGGAITYRWEVRVGLR